MEFSSLAWCVGALAAFLWAAFLTARLVPLLLRGGVIDAAATAGRGRPVPRGGGFAIVAVVVVAAVIAVIREPAAAASILGAVTPALVVAAVSWRDDMRPLPAVLRLTVHLAAAGCAVALLGPLRRIDLGALGAVDTGPLAWPLSVLWIVGMTNAFNFIDGIDGIAGITTMAAAAAVAAAAAHLGAVPIAIVATALAAAAGGFLTSNWPPARIFLGDVGSTFCGFLLAVLPLAVAGADAARAVPVAALAVWPVLFDTALTLVRRAWRREDLLRPHRSHLYQRLVAAGWSHRAVSSLYGGLAAFAGAIAVATLSDQALGDGVLGLAVATPIVGGALLAGLVTAAERHGRPDREAAAFRRDE